MIHSVKFKALLDTNVIYPLVIRDLLFWFAYYDLYTPKWSENICKEWKDVMLRKNVSEAEAEKRIGKANFAFPDALVKDYQPLVDKLELPDVDDRHVLAAAIKSNANVIVTQNLKDFPEEYLDQFGIVAKSADDFLTDIIDLNADLAIKAFRDMVLNRKSLQPTNTKYWKVCANLGFTIPQIICTLCCRKLKNNNYGIRY